LTKRDGIKTLVRKLRLCQSARGRKRTRVECRTRGAGPSSRDDSRTIFRRLFFGKRIATLFGTILDSYKVESVKTLQHSDVTMLPLQAMTARLML
jgi:hypothetical protein